MYYKRVKEGGAPDFPDNRNQPNIDIMNILINEKLDNNKDPIKKYKLGQKRK